MFLTMRLEHWGLKVDKVNRNDDTWLILTYFTIFFVEDIIRACMTCVRVFIIRGS